MKVFPFCYNIKCQNIPKGRKYRCSVCKYATYCGEECQKIDWIYHKYYCKLLSIFEIKSKTMDEDQLKIDFESDQIILIAKLVDSMGKWIKYENSCECSSIDIIFCCLKQENYYVCYIRCAKYKKCKFVKIKPLFHIGEISMKLFWCSFTNRSDIVSFLNNGCKAYDNPKPGYIMITSDINGQPEPMLLKKDDKDYYMINYEKDIWESKGKKKNLK